MKINSINWLKKAAAWLLIFILSFIVVAFSTVTFQFGSNIKTTDTSEAFFSYMDERIPKLMEQYDIPGCNIALVKGGEIVWLKAYGFADVEKEIALTTDTPMRVQSISKPVTAWGVMKLVEQGEIDLDTPVSQYIKSWSFPVPKANSVLDTEKITVRQLLSHTSGLPLGDVFTIYSPGEEMPTLREKLTKEAIPELKVGKYFLYSNTGYNLLELVIEEVTGRDFSEYMSTEILSPLGMDSSSFEWSEKMNPAPPTGYNLKGETVPVYVYPEKASGGLFATAEDIARFTIASMGRNDVLDEENVELMRTTVADDIKVYDLVFDSYGFGHYLETLPNGELSASHGGQGSGIMTHMQFVPQSGDGIVVLTNSQRSWPFISYVLGDWADWRGFSSVGMEAIAKGRYAMCGVVAAIFSFSILLLWSLGRSVYKYTKQSVVFDYLKIQWFVLLLSIVIISVFVWAALQEYIFVTAVFPILSVWLGVAVLVLGILLLLRSLSKGIV